MPLTEEPEFPLWRVVLGIVAAFVVIGVGISWFSGIEAEKKADELHAVAQDHFRKSRLVEASVFVERALKLKEKPAYLETKVDVLLNQNKVYEADLALDKLIGYKPDNAHLRRLSGRLAFGENDLEEAVKRYREATKIESGNAEYKVELANILMRQDKAAEAKTLYEGLIKQDSNYRHAWSQYISALSNTGRYDEAVSVANRALRQFPDDSDFYFLLAGVYDSQNKRAEAVTAYRRSLELEPMKDSIAASRIFELTGKRVSPHLEKMDTDHVPFHPQDKLMLVDAVVNGQSGNFLIDTGASVCVLFKSRAARYKLVSSPLKTEVETANGTIQVPIAYGSVRLGKHQISPVLFTILPDPQKLEADGIIGMNFLEHFRFEIDRANQTISLKR